MRTDTYIHYGMIVYKIKMYPILLIDRVRPIIFQRAAKLMRLQ